jgi:enolase-phosphatase E1
MLKAILLDIEGTTTPIDFVHKVLFPYAKARVEDLVRDEFDELRPEILQLKAECEADNFYAEDFDENSPASIAAYLKHLVDIDRKSTPLKTIQGMIWQEGYESGELKSIVFDDVPNAFERWTAEKKTIAIYSSGSVLAQQYLFRYTDHGDLTPFVSDYFDTNVGGKRDVASYDAIAGALDINGSDILFVSDVPAELDAARSCSFQTALSIRPGNIEVAEDPIHPIVRSFDELP